MSSAKTASKEIKTASATTIPFDILEQEYQARQKKLQGLIEQRESLSGHLTDVDKQIADLRNPPDTLGAAIAKHYNIPPKSLVSHNGKPAKKPLVPKKIVINKPPMKERVMAMLKGFPKGSEGMTTAMMVEKLIAGGYQTTSTPQNLATTINAALGSDSRFKRTSKPGTFVLA